MVNPNGQDDTNGNNQGNNPPVNPNQTNDEAQISKVQIKVPPFWHESPEIWFAQVEAQFKLTGTTTDISKFNTVVGAVESKILTQVANAVLTPPANGKYENIKAQILDRYADTEHKKMSKLLSDMTLGDKKPSHLLNEMRRLGGANVTEEFLKTLWLQNLPEQVRAIISASPGDLTVLAPLADKVFEVTDTHRVNSVNYPCSTSQARTSDVCTSLETKIDALTKAIQSLQVGNKSSRSRSRSRSTARSHQGNQRSSTPAGNQAKKVYDMCWYHYRFGTNAKKCSEPEVPCNFNSKN